MDKKRIYELDTITEADLEKDNYLLVDFEGSDVAKKFKLRDILNFLHLHDNEEILDGITQEDIASIHSHNNMDFLEKCEYIYFNSSSSLDFVKEGLFLVKFSEIDWETSITEAKNSGKFARFDGITTGNSENKQIFLVMYVDKTVSEEKIFDFIVHQDGIIKKYAYQVFFGDGTIYKRRIVEITERMNGNVMNPSYETRYEFEPLEEIGSSGTEVDSTQIMGLQYYDDADIVPSEQSLFTFTVNDDGTTATLSGITGETISGNIVIPYKYTDENGNEYIVTDIGDNAFYQKTSSLNIVILPNTIKTIGYQAFYYTGLKSINFPKSLITIGNYAFCGCSNLSNIKLNEGLKTIGTSAFYYCYMASPTIPSTVTTIGSSAFYGGVMGGHVTIPEGVTVINNDTFVGGFIKSVKLPNTLKSIEGSAFNYCQYLTQIEIPDSVTNISSYAFTMCGTAVEGAEFTIICSAGSYAEQYAKENGIKYKYTITDVTQQYVDENSGVGQTTDNNGEIFNDYKNNKALVSYTHAEGYSTSAGSSAYRIVGKTHDTEAGTTTFTLDSVEGLEVGDVFTVTLDSFFPDYGSITLIDTTNSTVTVDVVIDQEYEEWRTEGDDDKNVFRIREKPELGTVYIGMYSHTKGYKTRTAGVAAYAEGKGCVADGSYSHAEGRDNIASYLAHTEGRANKGLGGTSHTEGNNNTNAGNTAHVEGLNNSNSGYHAHVEGAENGNSGENTHVEGFQNIVEAVNSHIEGGYNKSVKGGFNHIEGIEMVVDGDLNHTEGYGNNVVGNSNHVEGKANKELGAISHTEGNNNTNTGTTAHVEGLNNSNSGYHAHVEGAENGNSGENTHVEGFQNIVEAVNSHIEGGYNKSVKGEFNHIEGVEMVVDGDLNHTEGYGNNVVGNRNHVVGLENTLNGYDNHLEGTRNTVNADNSHIEGFYNIVQSNSVHVEGSYNEIKEDSIYSHIEGSVNIIESKMGHAEGNYNRVVSTCGHAEGSGNFIGIKLQNIALIESIDTENYSIHLVPDSYSIPSVDYNMLCTYNIINLNTGRSIGIYGNINLVSLNNYCIVSVDPSPLVELNLEYPQTKENITSNTAYGIVILDDSGNSIGNINPYALDIKISGASAHVQGIGNIASGDYQDVLGKYNEEDSSKAVIVGNGENDNNRSNAYTLDWDGNAWFAGEAEVSSIILRSSTEGSTKKFRLTIDDDGVLKASEIE